MTESTTDVMTGKGSFKGSLGRRVLIGAALVGVCLGGSACVSNGSGHVGGTAGVDIVPSVNGQYSSNPTGFHANRSITNVEVDFTINNTRGKYSTYREYPSWGRTSKPGVWHTTFAIPGSTCWLAESVPGSGTVSYSDGSKEFFAVSVPGASICVF